MAFWRTKLLGNQERDRKNLRTLRRVRWKMLVVWECQTANIERLTAQVGAFLASP